MPALVLVVSLLAPTASAQDPVASPAVPVSAEPIRVVEDSLVVPADLDPEAALDSVSDIARIFELYQPSIPWVPGVKLDLEKQVLSTGAPTLLELPVKGNVAGKDITEVARVTATAVKTTCGPENALPGRTITLDFHDSSYNIERRIDRIEIAACLLPEENGARRIDAVGRMYAGFLPEDPSKNAMMEAIGAKAIQVAFLRQVDPILVAVEHHWADLH